MAGILQRDTILFVLAPDLLAKNTAGGLLIFYVALGKISVIEAVDNLK
jgi:hypothetical protein